MNSSNVKVSVLTAVLFFISEIRIGRFLSKLSPLSIIIVSFPVMFSPIECSGCKIRFPVKLKNLNDKKDNIITEISIMAKKIATLFYILYQIKHLY